MDWKKEAVSKLRQYVAKNAALENIPREIHQQELNMERIRSADPDNEPIKGQGQREDAILNSIVYRESLVGSYTQVMLWTEAMERALRVLNSEERTLLERFYIYPEPKAADRLAGDLHVDIKTVYRRKDDALRKFTMALYGVTEI